jgi:hypothetical protein
MEHLAASISQISAHIVNVHATHLVEVNALVDSCSLSVSLYSTEIKSSIRLLC